MSQNNRLCTWKNTLINDERKLREGNYCTTFSLTDPNLKCLSCNGYNASCEAYAPIKRGQGETSNSKLEKVTA